jgi:hypothetical protein
MYIALPFVGFIIVGAVNTLTPSAVYAERIPFAIQNSTQSTPGELVEGLFQIAVLLPQRDDGKFYSAQLTYTSSSPVEVEVLQPAAANVSGAQPTSLPGLNASIASLDFDEPKRFNSVTFTGSQVILLHRSPEPFTVSYSIVGEALDPEPLPQ